MYYYEINEDGFLINRLENEVLGCYTTEDDLGDLKLTWDNDDYSCWKYQIFDEIIQVNRITFYIRNNDINNIGTTSILETPGAFEISSDIVLGGQITKYTVLDGVLQLKTDVELCSERKAQMIAMFSEMSFVKRRDFVPDHQQINAALGVYDATKTSYILDTISSFRNEYYRLEALVTNAQSIAELDDILANQQQWPTST